MVEVPSYQRKKGRQYQLGIELGERLPPGMQEPFVAWNPSMYVPPVEPEPEVREHLMDNTAMAIAFDGGSDENIYIGLPEGDTDAEFYLIMLDSAREKDDFQRAALSHYEVNLKESEREWLQRQFGAIVEEDSNAGMTTVYFYESPTELTTAWEEESKRASRVNAEPIEEAIQSGELSPSGEVFPTSQTRLEV